MHFGSVSVSITVAKCVTSFKRARVIDPAHSSITSLKIFHSRSIVLYAGDEQDVGLRPWWRTNSIVVSPVVDHDGTGAEVNLMGSLHITYFALGDAAK